MKFNKLSVVLATLLALASNIVNSSPVSKLEVERFSLIASCKHFGDVLVDYTDLYEPMKAEEQNWRETNFGYAKNLSSQKKEKIGDDFQKQVLPLLLDNLKHPRRTLKKCTALHQTVNSL